MGRTGASIQKYIDQRTGDKNQYQSCDKTDYSQVFISSYDQQDRTDYNDYQSNKRQQGGNTKHD
jgi:hypothetical protein